MQFKMFLKLLIFIDFIINIVKAGPFYRHCINNAEWVDSNNGRSCREILQLDPKLCEKEFLLNEASINFAKLDIYNNCCTGCILNNDVFHSNYVGGGELHHHSRAGRLLSSPLSFDSDTMKWDKLQQIFQIESNVNFEEANFANVLVAVDGILGSIPNPEIDSTVNDSPICGHYIRKGNLQYDSIVYFYNKITQPYSFFTGMKYITMDIYSINLPVDTEVVIHLEKAGDSERGWNSLQGKHSQYSARTSNSETSAENGGWERLKFSLDRIIDSNVDIIDQIVIYFAPNSYTGNTFIWDNLNMNYIDSFADTSMDNIQFDYSIMDFDGTSVSSSITNKGGHITLISNPEPTSVINYSNTVAKYTRSSMDSDDIQIAVSTVSNISQFITGDRVFTMDIYTGEGSLLTGDTLQVDLQLQSSDAFAAQNTSRAGYTQEGIHSEYTTTATLYRTGWQKVKFDLKKILDSSISANDIDSIGILFNPDSIADVTVIWDNLDINLQNKTIMLENFDGTSLLSEDGFDGTMRVISNPTDNINNSTSLCGEFSPNSTNEFQGMRYNFTGIDPKQLFEGRFLIDVFHGSVPTGTQLLLHYKSQAKFTLDYPTGIHSRYQGYATNKEGWESIEFTFYNVLDQSVLSEEIDSFSLVFVMDPAEAHGRKIIWDNLRFETFSGDDKYIDVGLVSILAFDEGSSSSLGFSNGVTDVTTNPDKQSSINPSSLSAKYKRSTSKYDSVKVQNVAISDISGIISGEKVFIIDIYSIDLPIGSSIVLQLQNDDEVTNANYIFPIGIHSRFTAVTTTTGEWERLIFEVTAIFNPSVAEIIDAINIHFALEASEPYEFYWDNLMIEDTTLVNFELDIIFEDFDGISNLDLIDSRGIYNGDTSNPGVSSHNLSPGCSKYVRSSYEDDYIIFSTAMIQDAQNFVLGKNLFLMDVYAESKIEIEIQLVNYDKYLESLVDASGVHSRYRGFLSSVNSWTQIEFEYLSSVYDLRVGKDNVDSIIILFSPDNAQSVNVYWDNLISFSDPESLSSSGVLKDLSELEGKFDFAIETFNSVDNRDGLDEYTVVLGSDGVLEIASNPSYNSTLSMISLASQFVYQYARLPWNLYDAITLKTNKISDASHFVAGKFRFVMELYVPSSERVEVEIQLQSQWNIGVGSSSGGRHSRYSASSTLNTAGWEKLQFTFQARQNIDVSDTSVDEILILFTREQSANNIYYWDNFNVESIAAITSPLCVTDDGWMDKDGKTCLDYEDNQWCYYGAVGSEWANSWGDAVQFTDFKNKDGFSADDKCCACTTTNTTCTVVDFDINLSSSETGCCTDVKGWSDTNGHTCADYYTEGWCKGNGGYESSWIETFGPGITFKDLSPSIRSGLNTGGADENCCMCMMSKQPVNTTTDATPDGECVDTLVSEWVDSEGKSCEVYNAGNWCDSNEVGTGWKGRRPVANLVADEQMYDVQSFAYSIDGEVTGIGVECFRMVDPNSCSASVNGNICIIDYGWEEVSISLQITNCKAAGGVGVIIISKDENPLPFYDTNLGPLFGNSDDNLIAVTIILTHKPTLLKANTITLMSMRGSNLDDYANADGKSAITECCGCAPVFGDVLDLDCIDDTLWSDSDGLTCDVYEGEEWCREGYDSYGDRWGGYFGDFIDYSNIDGVDASSACCACHLIQQPVESKVGSSFWWQWQYVVTIGVYVVGTLVICGLYVYHILDIQRQKNNRKSVNKKSQKDSMGCFYGLGSNKSSVIILQSLFALWISLSAFYMIDWWKINSRNYIGEAAFLSPENYQHLLENVILYPALTTVWCRCFTKFVEVKKVSESRNFRRTSLAVTVIFFVFGIAATMTEITTDFDEFRVTLVYMYPIFWCGLIVAMTVQVFGIRRDLKISGIKKLTYNSTGNNNTRSMRRLFTYGLLNLSFGFSLSLTYVIVRRFNPGLYVVILFDLSVFGISSGFLYLIWPALFPVPNKNKNQRVTAVSGKKKKTPITGSSRLKKAILKKPIVKKKPFPKKFKATNGEVASSDNDSTVRVKKSEFDASQSTKSQKNPLFTVDGASSSNSGDCDTTNGSPRITQQMLTTNTSIVDKGKNPDQLI